MTKKDPYRPGSKRTPLRQTAVTDDAAPTSDQETKERCPTCRGRGHITAVEAAALEEEAKRRERCICQ